MRRKILSHSFLLKKGLIKLPLIMNKSLFSMFSGSWIRPSLQQLYCLSKETFCPHLSLICKEDSNYGKTKPFCLARTCKGVVAPQSTVPLSLTSQNSRIPKENGNPEATGIIRPVTKPLCSSCSFCVSSEGLIISIPSKPLEYSGYRHVRSWEPGKKRPKTLWLHEGCWQDKD